MKILFIGGTGVISSACSELAVQRGLDLYLLNRGQTARPVPAGATVLQADIRDPASVRAALGGHSFDAVVDWIAFTPEHIQTDIDLFRGCTGQYIFISSASVYQTPPARLPVTESTPLDNPYWEYSRQKIACEEMLVRAYRDEKFPMTIVRPSHTYDRTKLPLYTGYTQIARMRQGKKAVVPGDGTSLWVLTHNTDFAKGFVPLLGDARTIGEAFHITSDEILTWNQIYTMLARAAGVEPQLAHVASDTIARFDKGWGEQLHGDKAHSMVFDNTKIKRMAPDFAATTPFSRGAREIIAWYDENPSEQIIDEAFDRVLDEMLARMDSILP